jgi:hypothetical protein
MSSATSRVLLNNNPGTPFAHARGLQQGDPLSRCYSSWRSTHSNTSCGWLPQRNILKTIHARTAHFRISFYADDAGIFANPDQDELGALSSILTCFGQASGLSTNMNKSKVFPIRCGALDISDTLLTFSTRIAHFPGCYLGLPLHSRRLRKVDYQPLIDKVNARLTGWKGKNLTRAGRIVLAKTVLSATATYHLSVLQMPKWVRARLDRITRGFI